MSPCMEVSIMSIAELEHHITTEDATAARRFSPVAASSQQPTNFPFIRARGHQLRWRTTISGWVRGGAVIAGGSFKDQG